MKAFNGFKAERRTVYEPLPAGGYEAIVKDAEEINGYLKISFDFSDTPDEKAIEKERYHAHFDSHLCHRRRPPARGCGT